MRRLGLVSALCACVLLQPAHAGPYADDLARCMVTSTSAADKAALVRWIFANAAVHPDVGTIAAISDTQRTEINQAIGQLITRLLTEPCRQQVKDAMQYEGQAALQAGFGVLGEVAMTGLMADPAVSASFGAMAQYLDAAKLAEVSPLLK